MDFLFYLSFINEKVGLCLFIYQFSDLVYLNQDINIFKLLPKNHLHQQSDNHSFIYLFIYLFIYPPLFPSVELIFIIF